MAKAKFLCVIAVLLFLVLPGISYAYSIDLMEGYRSANVNFNLSTTNNVTNLTVTLTNTSSQPAHDPKDAITAVFFDIVGIDPLTPSSARVVSIASIYNDTYDEDKNPITTNVGGEWAYGSKLSGAPYGATEGISSSGLGLFSTANFNGPDLEKPQAVDGPNYAIIPSSGLSQDAAPGFAGFPLISNSVTFILTGNFPSNFVLDKNTVKNVSVQYGTSLCEPNITTPIPPALLLLSSGLIGLVGIRRKKKTLMK